MLKNPGLKIQVIARIYFGFFVLAGIIAAVIFAVPTLSLKDSPLVARIVICCGCVVGGIILGLLSCLPFYAFGTLVADTAENKATLLRIEELEQNINFLVEDIANSKATRPVSTATKTRGRATSRD